MRENTKWIMLATALAFVALMVFEWGMDITGRSAGGLGEIGRVNGQPVMYDDYMAAYRGLYDQMQAAQEEPLTSQQNRQLEDQAWDQVVTRILIEQELERRGIEVSDDEILNAAAYSPPPAFRAAPEFQTDGQFDLQKYRSFIQSPQVDEQTLLYLESYYRDVIPRGKLLRQLTSGVYVTDAELWQRWREQNESVQIRYVPLDPAQRIQDAEVELGDREVRAYYEEHRDDFEVPAQATIKVVVLPKAPTAADSSATLERARQILEEIRGGGDFAEVATRVSADVTSAQQGGDLGTFGRGDMTETFDQAAFSLPIGQVAGPVQSPYGYHLLEVQKRTADSATARHILLPIERTDESEFALLARADSLEEMAEDQGLEAAARALGLPASEIELNQAFPIVAGAGQVGEGADWAFEEAAPGDVSPVFENAQAFYAMELVSARPAGTLPFEDARPTVEQVLRLEKKTQRALEQGQEIVRKVRAGTPLPDAAAERGLEVRTAGPFSRQDFVPGIGRLNAAVGAAFGLATGEVSDPVKTPSNVFVLEQVGHTPADSAQWLEQKDAQRQQVLALTQQQRLDLWVEGVKAEARIVDRRKEVLQPAQDAPLANQGPFGY